jgi:hypothetical protein
MGAPAPTPGMRGAIVWAFTAFQPEAPFELVTEDGGVGLFDTAADVAAAIKAGELSPAPRFVAPAKLRPLVLLQDRPRGVLPEYAALKLARLGKLGATELQRVRDGDDPALFHLRANPPKYGLKEENAVDLNSLVRVHRSAILTRPVGRLDENEIDVLGRRLARFLDVDLQPAIRQGIMDRWEKLVADQQARRRGP